MLPNLFPQQPPPFSFPPAALSSLLTASLTSPVTLQGPASSSDKLVFINKLLRKSLQAFLPSSKIHIHSPSRQKLGQAGGSQFSDFSRISRSKRGGARPGGFQATYGHGDRFQASCGRRGGFQATCGHGGFLEGHGRCGSGRRKKTSDKSADQLDKELDSYHAEAMNTS